MPTIVRPMYNTIHAIGDITHPLQTTIRLGTFEAPPSGREWHVSVKAGDPPFIVDYALSLSFSPLEAPRRSEHHVHP
jgi:hypothetical protein